MDPFPLPQIDLANQNLSIQFCRTRRRQLKKVSPCGNWTPEEDQLLLNLVENSTEKKHWQGMASKFQNKTPQQIMNRYNKVVNPSLVKGNWTKEEDESLVDWVKNHGEKEWTKIASKLPGRIGKQCRERWFNCLKPNIKRSGWTEEEDEKIIELQSKFGNKWAKIAEFIEGRTDNQIKNRWNSVLKKKIVIPQDIIAVSDKETDKNSQTKQDETVQVENANNSSQEQNNNYTQAEKQNETEGNNDTQTNDISTQPENDPNPNQGNNTIIHVEYNIIPENCIIPPKANVV